MSLTTTYPALSIHESGTVTIRGTRYKVMHLAVEHYEHGWTAEELLRQHPDLNPEQVYASLAYFYEHRDAFIAEMKRALPDTHPQNPSSFSRDALLAKWNLQQG